MSQHPCVVTINSRSKPRVLFCGTKLMEVDLPIGTRVIYPKPPIEPLQDIDAAIRYALNHPENSEPLYAKLRPGMKVTIAIDDLSMPLPPMQTPDIRQNMIDIVLELLDQYAVTDIELIVATAFHRPMTKAEIKRMVGKKTFDRFWPDRLYNHDAEKPGGLMYLGKTAEGFDVEINARAASSDLLIYINLTLVPMNGGFKSVGTGLAGYRTLRTHHNPSAIRKSKTYMDPNYSDKKASELATRMESIGRLINEKVDVFHIESTINNQMFAKPLDFLGKNEDELSPTEEKGLKLLVKTLDFLPQKARQAIFEKVPAPYGVIAVHAGETEATHERILERCYQQLAVPVEGQADIVVFPIPYISPYNVDAFLNPLLVSVMAEGYLFNLHRGAPLLKKGGTMIILHPCSDNFDPEQHLAYVEFFHKLLPQTRDAMELHKRFEKQFAKNPAYVQMYRTGKAYHPVHPFYMWYWGENGRQHRGRVIVVGADNEYIPQLLGYETAATMSDALRMARETAPEDPDITCFRICPLMLADVTVKKEIEEK
ncbi:MAG: lactate racemase domain-containing protein [Myxococcota bacterium]|nr:lactate racemase domain-containing protein [Myxococcota bacterium]